MTPKEEYDLRQRHKKERQMAEDDEWTARKRKEQAAEECFTVMLDGLRAFFEGKATLHVAPTIGAAGPSQGHAVRFIKDQQRS